MEQFFFRSTVFLYFTKEVAPNIPQWIRYILEEHLQPYIAYIPCIWQISLFKASWFFRSSHPMVFLGKDVLKICSKFTGENTWRSAISIRLLRNFIEIALRHGCSPVNLLHIFRTPFLKNTSGRLLLLFQKSTCSHTVNCTIVITGNHLQSDLIFSGILCFV